MFPKVPLQGQHVTFQWELVTQMTFEWQVSTWKVIKWPDNWKGGTKLIFGKNVSPLTFATSKEVLETRIGSWMKRVNQRRSFLGKIDEKSEKSRWRNFLACSKGQGTDIFFKNQFCSPFSIVKSFYYLSGWYLSLKCHLGN